MDSKMNNILVCSKISLNDTDVILIPNKKVTELNDGMVYKFILASNVFNDNKIYIKTDNGDIPVFYKNGKPLYLNQISKRISYPIRYCNNKFILLYKTK